jgi:hypothetical protein
MDVLCRIEKLVASSVIFLGYVRELMMYWI